MPDANASLPPFDHQLRTRIAFGAGRVDELGALAAGEGMRRVLLVTDAGVVRAGHVERARRALEEAGLGVVLFDAVRENPDTDDVDACLAAAREGAIDGFVGLGGGSSIDTAKGANFLLTNGGRMADYWGRGKATKPMLPMIAVPTTAGTGSECQSFALIADADSHAKMACGDPKAAPRVALLDPELTLTQPFRVTADTGIDTLTHALEAAVTRARTEVSALFARRAFTLTVASLPLVLEEPDDLEARGVMQLAAAWAGLAIEGSMLGAAHSAANPLTAHLGLVHGRAVGIMMPRVIRYNAEDPDVARLYGVLAVESGVMTSLESLATKVDAIWEKVGELLIRADMPLTADEIGLTEDRIPALAAEAAKQWTAQFNPRAVDEEAFVGLYRSLLGPLAP